MDPLLVIGTIANLAGLITFIDWAFVKSNAKKRKKPLDRSVKALEKLEISLREISVAIQEKKDLSEVEQYMHLLQDARADLVKELQSIGIKIPQEKAPKVRGFSDEALLSMVSLCERNVIRAKDELTEV